MKAAATKLRVSLSLVTKKTGVKLINLSIDMIKAIAGV
jgi:hypothetical protein